MAVSKPRRAAEKPGDQESDKGQREREVDHGPYDHASRESIGIGIMNDPPDGCLDRSEPPAGQDVGHGAQQDLQVVP